MSRPTADLIADLHDSSAPDDGEYTDGFDSIMREAADRLAELDAERAEFITIGHMHAEVVAAVTSTLATIDGALPPCPSCGGTKVLTMGLCLCHEGPGHHTTPCPENGSNCDGKVSIERMAEVFAAVAHRAASVLNAQSVSAYDFCNATLRNTQGET